jgi:hypothetical protein
MIAWEAFYHQGREYDLSHLHPSTIQYIQPEKGDNPERIFTVQVSYSLHCFSKKLINGADPRLHYSDARETRTFDFVRYELSKKLPEIIKGLNVKNCMHTGKGNYFVIEVMMPNGVKDDYEVYFEIKRSRSASGVANLYVQSAYVRDTIHSNRPPPTKKISLYVILNNTLAGKPIKVPK